MLRNLFNPYKLFCSKKVLIFDAPTFGNFSDVFSESSLKEVSRLLKQPYL